MSVRAALTSFVLFAATASADDSLRPYLERGPMVLVEQDGAGKFRQATSVVLIDAPVEKVWAIVIAFEQYKSFVPKVVRSDVVKREGNQVDARFEIDVPGPNEDYTIHYVLDEAKHQIEGTWAKGDLKGSHWLWKAEATADGKTLLSQAAQVKNFSSIAQSLEDDQQTITVGVNVSSVLAATKAMKRQAEKH